jgi:hypothetical protein
MLPVKTPNLVEQLTIKTNEQAVKTIAEMRFMSESVGVVYEAQVDQLKKLAALVFEPAVAVISIMPDSRFIKVESPGEATDVTEKYPEMCKYVLGDGWTVQMCYNVKHGPAKTGSKRNRTKPARKKRARNARGK